MDKIKLLKGTLWLLFLTAIVVVICYFYIDKQVVIWISQHNFRSSKTLKYLSQIPELFIAVVPIFYLYVVIRFSFDRWTKLDQRLLKFANVIAVTQFLKEFFKFVFGRYWPATWESNNPSFVKDHLYGFHFFHNGEKYKSFPSGHAATLVAGLTILWFIFPRLRILYVLIFILSTLSILLFNYHFVSDVIAGSVLGFLTAIYTAELSATWKLAGVQSDKKTKLLEIQMM